MTEATGAVRRPMSTAVRRCERAKILTELDTVFNAHSSRAAEAVKALEPFVRSANGFIKRTAQRKENGELDKLTIQAELVTPTVVIVLADALRKIFDKAQNAKDSFTLRCVRTAAITLRAHVESGLLKEGHYPKDPGMVKEFVRQNFGLAAKAHADVLNALGHTHMSHSIEIPGPPTAPTAAE